MPSAQFEADFGGGIDFTGYATDGDVIGVMGIQRVHNVHLIRHAYVLPSWQGREIGAARLSHLRDSTDSCLLIGAWADAAWAIRFYQRHGFESAPPPEAKVALLRTYWTVSARQIETSVVLASPSPLALAAGQFLGAGR
jgi:GNAT superfamily N-acetyltransferase